KLLFPDFVPSRNPDVRPFDSINATLKAYNNMLFEEIESNIEKKNEAEKTTDVADAMEAMKNFACTYDEALDIVHDGKRPPAPPQHWFSTGTCKMEDMDGTSKAARKLLEGDIKDGGKATFGFHFPDGTALKALNNQIRNLFLETVLKVCGVQTKEQLPEPVKTAMKLKDYDNGGHPLTVRRITAVKAAIDAQFNAAAENALGEIRDILNKKVVNEGKADKDECAERARTLVDATKGDAELLDLLTKGECHLARRILCDGDSDDELCSYEEVVRKMNVCRTAINELRTAVGEDKALYKRSLGQIGDFVKHPLRPGQITAMVAAVRGMDLTPVKDLLLAPGHDNKFKAVCRIQKLVDSAIATALVDVDGEGDAVQQALSASYCLLYDIICKELGRNALENLRSAMNGEPFRVEVRAVYDIAENLWEEAGDDDQQLKADVRKLAESISFCTVYHVLTSSVGNALGEKSGFKSFIFLPDDVSDEKRRSVSAMLKEIVRMEDIQPVNI
ncbi:MAG: hypothetical protein IKO55_18085, partial [Kiritimatiellae bacterium]|nr:hypothetical protein [Kiritimatiellia bacterium]